MFIIHELNFKKTNADIKSGNGIAGATSITSEFEGE